jgi:hypothetical protein
LETFRLRFGSPARNFGGFEDPISAGADETWASAVDVLKCRVYQEADRDVVVSADWRPAAAVVARGFEVEREVHRTRSFDFYQNQPKGWNVARVPVRAFATARGIDQSSDVEHVGSSHVEQFVYDCFLALNLACPGSANFRPVRIFERRKKRWELSLSSSLMETAWIYALRERWPELQVLNLGKVWAWITGFGFGVRQAAASPVERALFSVLHVCRHGRDDPAALIWLSHALEALFGSPKDAIVEKLRSRICDVLDVPNDSRRTIRRTVTRFYEVRSAFVHGTFRVVHPHENEAFDPAVDEYRETFIQTTDVAMALVLATLQLHIVNNWRAIEFKESYRGVAMDSVF